MQPLPALRLPRIWSVSEMIKVTVNGIPVEVREGATILEAARAAEIAVPTLCFLKDLNEVAACRICVVEVKGLERLVTACNTHAADGMEIETSSARVQAVRRQNLQLILSGHDCNCLVCARNGTCQLQTLAKSMNLMEDQPYPTKLAKDGWDKSLPLVRTDSRCISCLRCVNVCEKTQGLKVWDLLGPGARTRVGIRGGLRFEDSGCTLCGECIERCPVSALNERDDSPRFRTLLNAAPERLFVQVEPTADASRRARVADALRRIGVRNFVDAIPSGGARDGNEVYAKVLAPLDAKRACDRAGLGDLALTVRETDRILALYGMS